MWDGESAQHTTRSQVLALRSLPLLLTSLHEKESFLTLLFLSNVLCFRHCLTSHQAHPGAGRPPAHSPHALPGGRQQWLRCPLVSTSASWYSPGKPALCSTAPVGGHHPLAGRKCEGRKCCRWDVVILEPTACLQRRHPRHHLCRWSHRERKDRFKMTQGISGPHHLPLQPHKLGKAQGCTQERSVKGLVSTGCTPTMCLPAPHKNGLLEALQRDTQRVGVQCLVT